MSKGDSVEKKSLSARVSVQTAEMVDGYAEEAGITKVAALEELVRRGASSVSVEAAVEEAVASIGREMPRIVEEAVGRAVSERLGEAEARLERAAKSVDRAGRDTSLVRKSAGTAARASLATLMMSCWFAPSVLKAAGVYLESEGMDSGKAGAVTRMSRDPETGRVTAVDRMIPSDFYKWWWGIAGYGQRFGGSADIQPKLIAMSDEFLTEISAADLVKVMHVSRDEGETAKMMAEFKAEVRERLSDAKKKGKEA